MADMFENQQQYAQAPEAPKIHKKQTPSDPTVTEEVQKLEDMASKDATVIAQVRTIFPFKLFPTTLTVDRSKLTIDNQYFFWSHERKTILIQDIMTITIETDLFFATIKIEDRLAPINVATVRYLPKQAAEKFRTIAEGLRLGLHDNIDLSKVPRKLLATQAERIGGVQGTPPTT